MPFEFVGDILIEGGKIFEVLPSIEINVQSCEAIDVRGDIVIPGFVDTHRHTWQAPLRYVGTDWTISQYVEAMFRRFGLNYTPEDTYTALRLGIAETIEAGITQLFDWNHNPLSPAHADAVIQAHRDLYQVPLIRTRAPIGAIRWT